MPNITHLQTAVRTYSLDGWLFSSFHHRDKLSDELLGLSEESTATRRWFYVVFATRQPLKIVHAIEKNALATLPGDTITYCEENQLVAALSQLRNLNLAIHYDLHNPVFSFLDASTYQLLQNCGIRTVSASALIAEVKGKLNEEQIQSHTKAAQELYRIIDASWQFLASHAENGITEADVQHYISEQFNQAHLISDHPPIVAFGKNTANPHYETADSTTLLKRGDPVQFDIWAKHPGGIYADISWIGVASPKAPDTLQKTFDTLKTARNNVIDYLLSNTTHCITGADIDQYVRTCFNQKGILSAVKHRTGHSIDTECHGCGVNLDSIEFPDFRIIGNGCLFSVEPGLYFADYGMRTEINVLIQDGKPIVTGNSPIQHDILCF